MCLGTFVLYIVTLSVTTATLSMSEGFQSIKKLNKITKLNKSAPPLSFKKKQRLKHNPSDIEKVAVVKERVTI